MTTAAAKFAPEALPSLEASVETQVKSGTYDLESNLALLRLYLLYPERVNVRTLAYLLIKSIMALPDVDFSLCMNMVPERIQGDEPFASLAVMASHLEVARFRDFWAATDGLRDLLDTVPGFDDAVRAYICGLHAATHRRVPLAQLGEVVRLTGAPLAALVEAKRAGGWALAEEGGQQLVVFPLTPDNDPQPVQSESLSAAQLAPLFAKKGGVLAAF